MLINYVVHSCSYEKAPWVSEIQDKGDLFYVEQYADVPNSEHSTAQYKQTNQQNGGQVLKDKRLTGNKLFDHIRRMKKNKKTSDIISAKDNYDDQQRDTANVERDKKVEVKLRVNPPRIGPYKRDDLESVMGIIPLKSSAANDRDELSYSQEYGRDSKIIIAGFTPTGPAIASHQLEIGEYCTLDPCTSKLEPMFPMLVVQFKDIAVLLLIMLQIIGHYERIQTYTCIVGNSNF